jgi:HAD superfamily hydrolase (TIGR01662 family)
VLRKFSLVLFDLGSTLLYFDGDLPELVQQADRLLFLALRQLGYRLEADRFIPAFRDALRAYFNQRDVDFLEYTVKQVLRLNLAAAGYADVPEAHLKIALREMYRVTQAHWLLEPDALATLAELKRQGYRLGLISNAADGEDLRALVDGNGLTPWFEQILVSAEVGYRKPHPHIFHLALDFFETAPSQAVMVGDKLGSDVLGAQNAGIASVWLTRRASRSDNLVHEDTIQPDAMIASLADLPGVLERWQ